MLIVIRQRQKANNVPSRTSGLTGFLYQRDGEIIAFARPDLAVSGTGSLSVVPAVDIRAMSAV
jgi:hypothetical protein